MELLKLILKEHRGLVVAALAVLAMVAVLSMARCAMVQGERTMEAQKEEITEQGEDPVGDGDAELSETDKALAKLTDDQRAKGDSVVVFETLYRDGKEITAHADIDDEGQTVEFTEPSLGTTAEDGIDGDQSLVADGKAVIVDNVSYKGLVPGKPPKGGVYDKTGNMLSGYGWVAALLVVAAVAGAGYAGKQYLDARKEKDGDADGGES